MRDLSPSRFTLAAGLALVLVVGAYAPHVSSVPLASPGAAFASASGARHATARYAAAVTITLGSGTSTSLCVEPRVASVPVTSITSDPATGTYTCRVSTPGSAVIIPSAGFYTKYWGSPSGLGPIPIAGGASKWIGENLTGTSIFSPAPFVQTYIYDAEVTIPCLPRNRNRLNTPTLTGAMAADNAAYAYLNTHNIGTMPLSNPANNFEVAHPFGPACVLPSYWKQGTNTIHFVVHDQGDVAGLDYSLKIAIPAVDENCGTLKICKVAGLLVPVGTPFIFRIPALIGATTVTVPAGPAPGGYCKVVGTFAVGRPYKIKEAIPAGYFVTAITAAPPGGTRNLALGTFKWTIHAGINEVTYTDESLRAKKSGYLEICKQVPPNGAALPSLFVFHVGSQTIGVPPGACSPAFQVVAGSVTVTESLPPSYFMVACSTIPAANLVSCNTSGHFATVIVKPGGVSAGTILTITNRLG
jgi:hypothetical protein